MPFPYPPEIADQLTTLFRREKLQGTNRDLGQSSITAGDGMLEVRSASGTVLGGLGDLPDNTVGVGIFRNGTFKNINEWFFDRGQIDSAFQSRDARLNQHDQNDASHQSQLNTLRGDVTRLDGVDASIAQQLGDRYTKGQVDGAFASRDGAIGQAQSTANTARSEAGAAQSSANSAQSSANSAQSTANTARSEVTAARDYATARDQAVFAAATVYARTVALEAQAGHPIPGLPNYPGA